MINRIVEHDPTNGLSYGLVIKFDPISFEIALFNYMSQLEEVDEYAYITIYKDERGVTVSSHRMKTDNHITIDKSMSDSFLQYTLVDGNAKKSYNSLFDVDIPCKKTVLLTKNDNELILKVV